VLGPADQAHGDLVADRLVDEALDHIARVTVRDGVGLQVVAGAEAGGAGLVGDDPQGAGLRAGAVQGALRPGQGLDPGDVVDVDVQRALDRGDRLFVQIGADLGSGPEWLPSSPLTMPRMNTLEKPGEVVWIATLGRNLM
jgi:hypothetical protein